MNNPQAEHLRKWIYIWIAVGLIILTIIDWTLVHRDKKYQDQFKMPEANAQTNTSIPGKKPGKITPAPTVDKKPRWEFYLVENETDFDTISHNLYNTKQRASKIEEANREIIPPGESLRPGDIILVPVK